MRRTREIESIQCLYYRQHIDVCLMCVHQFYAERPENDNNNNNNNNNAHPQTGILSMSDALVINFSVVVRFHTCFRFVCKFVYQMCTQKIPNWLNRLYNVHMM